MWNTQKKSDSVYPFLGQMTYTPPKYALRVAHNARTLFEYACLHGIYPNDCSLKEEYAPMVETAVAYFDIGKQCARGTETEEYAAGQFFCSFIAVQKQKQLTSKEKGCLSYLKDAVMYQNEDWQNGDGFYHKEMIPVVARICKLCNAFDQLTGSRGGGEILSKEDAVRKMRTKRGAQFDPILFDLFERYLDEFMIERLEENANGK